jgi:hypothetical protein
MKLAWLVSSIALIILPLQAQERNNVTVTQLSSATTTSSGQSIVFPRSDAQVVASIYEIMPGAAAAHAAYSEITRSSRWLCSAFA